MMNKFFKNNNKLYLSVCLFVCMFFIHIYSLLLLLFLCIIAICKFTYLIYISFKEEKVISANITSICFIKEYDATNFNFTVK